MAQIFEHTRIINDFFTDTNRYECLTSDEELQLFFDYRNASSESEKDVIRRKIASANMRFVYSEARKVATGNDNIMDYVNDGLIGLYTAIDKFDPTTGFKFITYAKDWVRQRMYQERATTYQVIRRANGMKYGAAPERIRQKFYAENGRYPSVEEISEILFKEKGQEVKNLNDLNTISILSTNATMSSDDDEMTFESNPEFVDATASVNDFEKEVEKEENSRACNKYLSILSERDREIVKKSYGFYGSPMSADDIAEQMDLTAVRVRQILKKSVEVMAGAARRGR